MKKKELIRRIQIPKLLKVVNKSIRNTMAEDLADGIVAAEEIINVAITALRDMAVIYGAAHKAQGTDTMNILDDLNEKLKAKRRGDHNGK